MSDLPPGFVLEEPNRPNAADLPPGFVLESAPQPSQSGGILANAGAGANDFIAAAAGAPVDLMTGALNLGARGINALAGTELPQIENPVGGSESLKSAMGLIGADPRNIPTGGKAEQTARAVGAAIPATVAPYLGARAAIERGVTAGFPGAAARLFGGPGGPGQSGAATAAGATANAAVGAGGAFGGQVAEAQLPEDSPWRPLANFGGQAVGGGLVAGGMGLGKAGINYGAERAKELLGPFSPSYRDRLAGDILRRNASDPRALAEQLAADKPELVPGSVPTTFQLTGDQGIGQLERAVRTRMPEPFAARAGAQNAARVGQIQALAPEKANTGAVRDLLQQQMRRLDDESENLVRLAQKNAQQAFDMAGGRLNREDYGILMRDQLEAAKALAKQNESRLWKAIDPDGKLAINGIGVRETANRIWSEIPKTAKPPEGEELAVFGFARMMGNAAPFKDFSALRGRLLQAIRDERATAGETPALRRMQQLRASMDDAISNAADNAAQDDVDLFTRIAAQSDLLERGVAASAAEATARGNNAAGSDVLPGGPSPAAPGATGTVGQAASGPRSSARDTRVQEPRRPADLIEFLMERGGVRDDNGDLIALDLHRINRGHFGRLVRKNGLHPDHARELAVEAGYLHPDADVHDLTNALQRNMMGQRVFVESDPEAVAWREFDRIRQRGGFEQDIPFPEEGAGNLPPSFAANFDADAAARYRAAASATRERAETFKNKQVGPVLQTRGTPGDYRIDNSAVPERFMSSPEGVQAFLKAGGRPEILQEALAADLRRAATSPDGTLHPTRYQSWLLRRRDALRQFPDLQTKLANAATAQETVDQAAAAARQKALEFQRGAARHFLNAEPNQAVQSALNGKNPVADFQQLSRVVAADPDAKAGLQRAVAEYIARNYIGNTEAGTSGVAGMKSDAFQTFIRKNSAALRQVFSPDQVGMMHKVAADLQRSNRSIAGSKIPGQSNTAQDLAAQGRLSVLRRSLGGELTASAIGGLGGWLMTSGSGAGAAVGAVVGPAAKNAVSRIRAAGLEQTEQLVAEALLNPQLARTLLMTASPANRPLIAQRLSQQLGALLAAAPAEEAAKRRH